jgi:hypothetical protein
MKKLITILAFFVSLSLTAATYYVAPSGGNDSNAGMIGSPWSTWQKAFNTAVAGDTVFFRGGTWYPTPAYGNNVLKIDPYGYTPVGHDGDEGAPICYFNYPGEVPILDGVNLDVTTRDFNTMIMMYDCNFIYFRGITIRNMYQPKVTLEVAVGINGNNCQNMRFENMTIYNVSGRGYQFFGGFNIPVGEGGPPVNHGYDTTRWINCDSYNICDSLSADPGNAGDGWKTNNYPGSVFIHQGCRAWNVSDDGFDPSNNVRCWFIDCWSFNNGYYYDLGGMKVEGNGFKSGGVSDVDFAATPTRYYYNCIAANNKGNDDSGPGDPPAWRPGSGAGFYDLDYDPYIRNNARFYNCVAYHNTMGFYDIQGTLPKNSEFYNCIAWGSTRNDATDQPQDVAMYGYIYPESHNNWDWDGTGYPWNVKTDTVTVTAADFLSLDWNELDNARKTDGSLPDVDFMKLVSTSDLIDAGIDVGLPYSGTAPDIGWNEYGEAEVPVEHGYLKHNGKFVMYNGKFVKF